MKFDGITHKTQLRNQRPKPSVKMAVVPQAEHQRDSHRAPQQPNSTAAHLPAGCQGEYQDADSEVVRGSPRLLRLKIDLVYALIRVEKRHEQIGPAGCGHR